MHPSVIAKRKALANNRIVERAKALGEHIELDPTVLQALEVTSIRDPQAAEMLRLEAVANFIAHIAEKNGADAEVQPDTTVGEFHAEPVVEEVVPPAEIIKEPVPKKPATKKKPERKSSKK